MMRGMYAAISGLQAHQTMLDTTANNLSNVNTIGYKGQRTTFVDELSQLVSSAAGPNGNIAGVNPLLCRLAGDGQASGQGATR